MLWISTLYKVHILSNSLDIIKLHYVEACEYDDTVCAKYLAFLI
jgi:hypothetical protein